MEDIKVEELKKKFDKDEDFVLIDVREASEHEAFNVGGRLIPLGTLPSRLDELEVDKDQEIVLYCRTGNRSGRAKAFLAGQGFSKVRNLLGGMVEWKEKFGNEHTS